MVKRRDDIMIDNKKIAAFISDKRRAKGLTQQQIADKLNVTFQAVSKWESGVAYPNIELLCDLADILGVCVDDLLHGRDSNQEGLTYSKAGVDIHYTDSIKAEISRYLTSDDKRVLNGLGSFASLYDIKFDGISEPVLVLKSEEPGSKQKIAMEYGFTESICHDMINHLVNDIAVMGAKPLAVLDTIVCGSAEKETIKSFIKGMSDACKNNECSLVGGETSIQPSVIEKGTYILTASVAGIVDRNLLIDGSAIKEGDSVISVSSNGLHTNGYSLVRLMMNENPQIKNDTVDGVPFIQAIMKPHLPYYRVVKDLFLGCGIHGMAHITGGGIESNLKRVIPQNRCALIDLAKIRVLPVFKFLKANGNISDEEMLRTFNCGVGMVIVADRSEAKRVIGHISRFMDCYEIGEVGKGIGGVEFFGNMSW